MMILCIDDQPIRYRGLSKFAWKFGIHTVTTHDPDHFLEYLLYPERILGFCLDHDMPVQDGKWFAQHIRNYGRPTLITSVNPSGADQIAMILAEFAVPHMKFSATKENFASDGFRWLLDSRIKSVR